MLPSQWSLSADLRRLESLQFRRASQCGDVVRSFHKLRNRIERHSLVTPLCHVRDWLLCPLTLWAVDYEGIARHVVMALEANEEFDSDLALLLTLLNPAPAPAVQEKISAYEKVVSKGLYDHISKQPEKFLETETQHQNDVTLRKFWNQLKSRFQRHMKPNARGVIRRTLSRERNFDPYQKFDWRKPEARFRILFDALCYRWCLYGFENDKPLLLKISVNPTPHGTMIVIPRHFSLDGNRSLDGPAINEVHRAHGTKRQGRKLSLNRIQQRADAIRARQLMDEARKKGLKGLAAKQAVLREMGQDIRRVSYLKRLIMQR